MKKTGTVNNIVEHVADGLDPRCSPLSKLKAEIENFAAWAFILAMSDRSCLVGAEPLQ